MKRIAWMLVFATCVAAAAEAATTPATKSATTAKTTTATKTQTPAATPKATTAAKPARKSEPAESHSQMHLGLRSIGGALGFVSPENSDGTFTLGAFADCGRITPNIALEPRIDYWSKSQDSFGAKASLRDIIIGARGKYLFQTSNPKLMPFAGAGLSMHFVHAEVTENVPGFPPMQVEDSATKLGLDIGGGVSTPIGPRSDLLGEAWYGIVSDVSQFSLRVGMSYRLGN